MDTVRVLRITEITGPRDEVERQLENSLHGTKHFKSITIRSVTIGTYPEILELGEEKGGLPICEVPKKDTSE